MDKHILAYSEEPRYYSEEDSTYSWTLWFRTSTKLLARTIKSKRTGNYYYQELTRTGTMKDGQIFYVSRTYNYDPSRGAVMPTLLDERRASGWYMCLNTANILRKLEGPEHEPEQFEYEELV